MTGEIMGNKMMLSKMFPFEVPSLKPFVCRVAQVQLFKGNDGIFAIDWSAAHLAFTQHANPGILTIVMVNTAILYNQGSVGMLMLQHSSRGVRTTMFQTVNVNPIDIKCGTVCR